MRYPLIAMLVPLSACSTPAPPAPAVEVHTITVDRPVPVACVKAVDIPAEPPRIAGSLTGDARRDLDTVSASATRLRAWGVKLAAILKGCAG